MCDFVGGECDADSAGLQNAVTKRTGKFREMKTEQAGKANGEEIKKK